jgi:hypothetical protein
VLGILSGEPGTNGLKILGAGGVRRSRSGNPLIPSGFGVGMPEVTDDVWLGFADAVYLKWVLALPDLAGHRVKIRVTPAGLKPVDDLQIVAQIKPWPDGNVIGEGTISAQFMPDPDPLGGRHFYVEVPMPGSQAIRRAWLRQPTGEHGRISLLAWDRHSAGWSRRAHRYTGLLLCRRTAIYP